MSFQVKSQFQGDVYKLENTATALADRLVDGIIHSGNMDAWEQELLRSDAQEQASKFAAAIRATIAAEIAASKGE